MSDASAGTPAPPASERPPRPPVIQDVCDGCNATARLVAELCSLLVAGAQLHHGAEDRVRPRLGELELEARKIEQAR